MHSSTAFLVLALAASVAPSLSAPVYGRDVELVFSRNSPTAPAGAADQSGAISFGKIFKGIFGREDGELLARDDMEELFARAVQQIPAGAAGADQSGAISFGKIFKGIFGREDGELLAREDIEDLLAREDFEELLARAIPAPAGAAGADQSGAISFGKIFKGIFGRDEGELLSRDDIEELIARAAPLGAPAPNGAPADQSGAINFGRIFKGIFGREDDELLAREDIEDLLAREDFEELLARAAPAPAPAGGADQSGAINFGKIFKGIFGREDDELLARDDIEELFARAAPAALVASVSQAGTPDQSGALNFGRIFKGIFGREEEMMSRDYEDDLFARDDELYARDDELMARDDFEDLFARDDFYEFEARSLNELD